MNAFESGARKVIPAVLVYVRRPGCLLMIHRDDGGYHSGKWNGLGGKLEVDESPLEASRREVYEEAGIQLNSDAFKPLGILQFPNFKAHRSEDWLVFVYSAECPENWVPPKTGRHSSEGSLHWVPQQEVLDLNLWPGDRLFLPYVLNERPFTGTIWYEGEKVLKYWLAPF